MNARQRRKEKRVWTRWIKAANEGRVTVETKTVVREVHPDVSVSLEKIYMKELGL